MSSIQSTANWLKWILYASTAFNIPNGVFCWHISSYSEHCDWILSREKVKKRKFTEFRHFSFVSTEFLLFISVICHFFLSRSFDLLSLFLRREKSQLIFTPIWITILFIISTIFFTGKKLLLFQHAPTEMESPMIFFLVRCLHIFIHVLWFFIYFCFLQTAWNWIFLLRFIFSRFLQLFFAFLCDFPPCFHPIPVYFIFTILFSLFK